MFLSNVKWVSVARERARLRLRGLRAKPSTLEAMRTQGPSEEKTLVWRREVDGNRQQISNGFETAFLRRRNNNSFSKVSSSLPACGLPEWKLFHSNFFLIA